MEPNCSSCGTDKYLKFENYTPGYTNRQEFRTGQGSVTKENWVDPVASFFCQKCGTFNGHTVPNDWQPPADPDISDLISAGQYYSAPGRKNSRTADGGWVITM